MDEWCANRQRRINYQSCALMTCTDVCAVDVAPIPFNFCFFLFSSFHLSYFSIISCDIKWTAECFPVESKYIVYSLFPNSMHKKNETNKDKRELDWIEWQHIDRGYLCATHAIKHIQKCGFNIQMFMLHASFHIIFCWCVYVWRRLAFNDRHIILTLS